MNRIVPLPTLRVAQSAGGRPVPWVCNPPAMLPMPRQDVYSRDPKTYLAEDGTFLAWIRTGIALMGFGFVARFGLFRRELEAAQSGSPMEPTAFSVVLGIALIVSGVLVTIPASFKYMRRIRDLQQGGPGPRASRPRRRLHTSKHGRQDGQGNRIGK